MRMIHYRKLSQTYEHASTHNQAEASLAEEYVQQEFETLHQFLRQEEAFRLLAVKEERDEKMRRAKDRGDEINQAIKSLEDKIQLAEVEIDAGGDGAEFLQNYQDTMDSSRIDDCKPKSVCRALINVAKHLGNLRYAVWEKMKQIVPFTPVTLDSKTAGPALRVSSGFSSVHVTPGAPDEVVAAPANPERFHPNSCVLAAEGFSSGVHCWDVEVCWSRETSESLGEDVLEDCSWTPRLKASRAVRGVNSWTLGVAAQWVSRKVPFAACPEAGLWCLSLSDRAYRALTTPPQIVHINGSHHLRKVRVRLDCEGGTLEFTNADTDEHLFTFTHCFTETVFPYFESISPGGNLAVMAQSVTISVGSDRVSAQDTVITGNNQGINSESTAEKETRDRSTVNGHSTEETKPPKCVAEEEKTTKSKQKNKKASNSKTAGKQKKSKRFNVSYHVSLNKALRSISKECQTAK